MPQLPSLGALIANDNAFSSIKGRYGSYFMAPPKTRTCLLSVRIMSGQYHKNSENYYCILCMINISFWVQSMSHRKIIAY